jgi:hypothetical protein
VPPCKTKRGPASALLKEADEFEQIASEVSAFGEEMNVVGHQTKSVQSEEMAGRAFEQNIEDALGRGGHAEIRQAVVRADGDEIGLAAQVAFSGETLDSTVDSHTEREYIRRGTKAEEADCEAETPNGNTKSLALKAARRKRKKHGSEDPPLRFACPGGSARIA